MFGIQVTLPFGYKRKGWQEEPAGKPLSSSLRLKDPDSAEEDKAFAIAVITHLNCQRALEHGTHRYS